MSVLRATPGHGLLATAALLALASSSYSQPVVPNNFEADYKTEQESRSGLGTSTFIFDFSQPDTVSGDSSLRGLFINNNPALGTLPGEGVGQNLVTLAACTVNQPHSHPRGTEISHITEGELLFGFHEENNGRFISGNVTKGSTVIIPQGLIHFASNTGCSEAQFIATFPSRDPGTQTTASNLFLLPRNVLRATLGLDDDTIDGVASSVSSTKNPSQDPQCLKRCGIAATPTAPGPDSSNGYRRL